MSCFFALNQYLEANQIPQTPCYSTIKEAAFVDNNHQHDTFTGGFIWRPHQEKLAVSGTSKSLQGSRVINRTFTLDEVHQHKGVIHARVAAVDIAAGDQWEKEPALLSTAGAPLTLIFKPLTAGKWLLMINDNWITVCEKK